MRRSPGAPPGCVTAAGAARCVSRNSRRSTGRAGRSAARCASSSSPPRPTKRKSGRTYYRAPAYLLTTDLKSPASALIQIYLDRWQIEVNHREEKDTLGVGQAQLSNEKAVPRQPVLAVAACSALLLAGLLAFGEARGQAYAPLPAWRRKARRPSCLDLVALLRKEVAQHPEAVLPLEMSVSSDQSIAAAAA
jgi:hypothetical protein